MEDSISAQSRSKWLDVPIIATVTRYLCKELTLQNEYLKTENRILRSKIPGRVPLDDDDRRALVDSAVAMGRDLMKTVVNIVKPNTILAWQRRLNKEKWDYSDKQKTRSPGRPRMSVDIESLVCRLARENTWGYEKIQGELKKLEINLTDTTVANILYRNGLPTAPDRKGPTWREFLSRHADVFLCADFLTQEVWTVTGLKTAYIFFVIHLQTRKVLLSRATFSPNTEWLKQQARHVLWECDDQNIQPRFFLCDRDPSFSEDFRALLKSAGVKTIRTPRRAPNANSQAERWILSLRSEVLNHLILFGLNHLQRVLDIYQDYFNNHRPHQGLGNCIPAQFNAEAETTESTTTDSPPRKVGDIECQEFLGGLLKSYSRKAA